MRKQWASLLATTALLVVILAGVSIVLLSSTKNRGRSASGSEPGWAKIQNQAQGHVSKSGSPRCCPKGLP